MPPEKTILIFHNEDSASGSLVVSLRESFGKAADIRLIGAKDIHADILKNEDPYVFFLPGTRGDSSGYRNQIGADGFAQIREWVRGGGVFVGLCAGAYLACANFRYYSKHEKTIRHIATPLQLFNAAAQGPISQYTDFQDTKNPWADHAIARLDVTRTDGTRFEGQACYARGPMIDLPPGAEGGMKIIARYADVPKTPIAMASREFGRGMAIFSGVVPEISGLHMPKIDARLQKIAATNDPYAQYGRNFARMLSAVEPARRAVWNRLIQEIHTGRTAPKPASTL